MRAIARRCAWLNRQCRERFLTGAPYDMEFEELAAIAQLVEFYEVNAPKGAEAVST